jgi:hypothetical protein
MNSRTHRDIFADEIAWLETDAGARTFTINMNETDTASPQVVLADFPSGFSYSAHTHGCNYVEYVVSGRITVGKISYGPGDVRVVKAGGGYGPLKVGEEGCRVVIVFERADTSFVELLPRQRDAAKGARH